MHFVENRAKQRLIDQQKNLVALLWYVRALCRMHLRFFAFGLTLLPVSRFH